MASRFFFSLESIKPQTNTASGSLITVTSKETPGLVNISFSSLKLNKRGSLEPIWHPNANKLAHHANEYLLERGVENPLGGQRHICIKLRI